MKVAVAGTGYVGLVTGVVFSEIGHQVTCVDIDEAKIKLMRSGISPIYEPGLEELMNKNSSSITYTSDYKTAYKDAEVIFIGVGTPEKEDGSANLEYIYKVCDDIIESIADPKIVVVKSTVPIGTNGEVEAYINSKLKNCRVDVASNPEFLAQGTAVKDSLFASRIVVGVESENAEKIMAKLYKPLTEEPYNVPLLFMSRNSAEMVKYASNDFLALKVSYINEIANLCEKLKANIEDVTHGMSFDSRIGNKFLCSGIGYGGSCFPKDTKALHWLSVQHGNELKTIHAAIEVNKYQKIKLFEDLKIKFNNKLRGLNITVLGLTFKPFTDDLREAPSIDNVELLLEYGANVTVYDPVGLNNFTKLFADKVKYQDSIEAAIKNADAVMIMTEWPQIKDFTLEQYKQLMKTPVVFDGRNCYNPKEAAAAGIDYKSIGRP